MSDSVVKQVMELQEMDARALRKKWRSLYDSDPPTSNSRQLVARLAYRIQERAYGGLSRQAREKLGEIADELERTDADKGPEFLPGTRFVRDYRGKHIEVIATENGFTWEGQPYKSLTAAAAAITGCHRNGRRFFGVKTKKRRER